jgi:hypothetical protein
MADNNPIRKLVELRNELVEDIARWTLRIDEMKDKRALAQAAKAEVVEAIQTLRDLQP